MSGTKARFPWRHSARSDWLYIPTRQHGTLDSCKMTDAKITDGTSQTLLVAEKWVHTTENSAEADRPMTMAGPRAGISTICDQR